VGLDPHLGLIPELFRSGSMAPLDPRTPVAVESFLTAVVDRLGGRVAIVKPQIAFFEQLGWPGLRLLASVVERCRARGLLVLLDAKRGDVGSTAAAYAAAYLAPGAPLAVDALTLSPYLGRDSLAPFVDAARQGGRGLFVLVKTSNPGSGDFQDRGIEGGGRLYEEVAAALGEAAQTLRGPATGFSSLGAVVGATYPEESLRVRERLPASLFLVPGYGAQGASARDAVAGFVAGPNGRREGGVVSSSRAVLFPSAAARYDAGSWERATAGADERAAGELAEAVARV
jgi:orotidine-5'-phosphate decarboxylase